MAIFNTVYGGEWSWQPWANTMIYYKFDWNLNDSSWNNNNWTAWWTIIYWTNYANLTSWYITVPNISYTNNFTVSIWAKCTTNNWYITDNKASNMFWRIQIYSSQYSASTDYPSYSWVKYLWNRDDNWHLITMSASSSWVVYYLDGVQKQTSSAISSWTYTSTWTKIWTVWNGTSADNPWLYAWHFIIESVARTADEISEYYNKSKKLYS